MVHRFSGLHLPRLALADNPLPLFADTLSSRVVAPEEVKLLRKELKVTARQLTAALGLEDEKIIFAWESGEQFPTKQYVTKMEALRALGPGAFPGRKVQAHTSGMARLRDPELWALVSKLLAHPALFEKALKLAKEYDDPES